MPKNQQKPHCPKNHQKAKGGTWRRWRRSGTCGSWGDGLCDQGRVLGKVQKEKIKNIGSLSGVAIVPTEVPCRQRVPESAVVGMRCCRVPTERPENKVRWRVRHSAEDLRQETHQENPKQVEQRRTGIFRNENQSVSGSITLWHILEELRKTSIHTKSSNNVAN